MLKVYVICDIGRKSKAADHEAAEHAPLNSFGTGSAASNTDNRR